MERFLIPLFLLLSAVAAHAQDSWPSRPIHVVVPFTPGTGADILSRVLGPKLSERLKVPIVVDNKPGATGNIGADFVAKAPADGLTLLVTATSFGTTPALRGNTMPFDPLKDFAPVGLIATSGLVVIVNPQLPVKSMRDFIDLVKREPGKLHYSSPGSGGPQHLAMELLKLETGMDIVHVPYKGEAGARADVVGGHVDATVSALQTAHPQIVSGKLRALGVMSAERAAAYPDVPTLKEQGVPDVEVETWYGALAPAGTPAAIVTRLNEDINAALKDPSVRDFLAKQGLTAAGGSPERMGELIRKEITRWTRVVKAAGIKAD
jgi:tripartite-type tricarboxylate transporter receptor subunit TctC